jgi:predicted ABC-type sugar transport system permease subunit
MSGIKMSEIQTQLKSENLSRNLAGTLAALWSWFFLAGLIVFFDVWARIAYGNSFLFNAYNVQSILVFASAPLLLGLGETLVIIAGGIDLSVGFIMGLASVVMAQAMRMVGIDVPPGVALVIGTIAAIAISAVPGGINGFLIARLGVPAFIGTLGMYGVARGAGYILADGATVSVDDEWLQYIGSGKILGVPIAVILTAVVVLALHYTLSQTKFGQYTYAIGANREAATRAGINVKRHTTMLYIISAMCAGLAGILFTARFSAGAAQAGEPLLLDSIAAVVIGGASLFGGSGNIIGTVIGAFIIAIIQFGLVFVDVKPFWQFAVVGIVIIISVLVDQQKRKFGQHP